VGIATTASEARGGGGFTGQWRPRPRAIRSRHVGSASPTSRARRPSLLGQACAAGGRGSSSGVGYGSLCGRFPGSCPPHIDSLDRNGKCGDLELLLAVGFAPQGAMSGGHVWRGARSEQIVMRPYASVVVSAALLKRRRQSRPMIDKPLVRVPPDRIQLQRPGTRHLLKL